MHTLKEKYSEIFNHRGSLYHQAMEKFPDVRKEEFQCALDNIIFNDDDIVCDIPSGGGYIAPYINKNCDLILVEFSEGFTRNNTENNLILASPDQIPLKDHSINTAISIAGVHHHKNQQLFYNTIYSSLKNNGAFILSDVQISSNVAFFLDNIVGKYNSTGHQGIYLSSNTKIQLENSGFTLLKMKLNKFSWIFDSLQDITDFMIMFFDMKNISHTELIKEIDDNLGIDKSNGKYYVGWSLLTFHCEK